MNALKALFLALLVSGCASDWRGAKFSEAEALQLFGRFEQLYPPFSSAQARRSLGDPVWTARSVIWRQKMLGGYIPLRGDFLDGSTFGIGLTKPKGQEHNYSIWLHATSDIRTPDQLRAFFSGVVPSASRITEFSLCYPGSGRVRYFPDSPPTTITQ